MDSRGDQQEQAVGTQPAAGTDEPSKGDALRSQRAFRTQLIAADVLGAVILLLVALLWLYLGVKNSLHWTWYLIALVPIWEIAFTQTYRMQHTIKLSEPDEPLTQVARDSLTHVEDQIWLQSHALWWRFVPYLAAAAAFIVGAISSKLPENWSDSFNSLGVLAGTMFGVACTLVLTYFVIQYALSKAQHAMLSELETRRRELLSLLARLGEKVASEG